ncbi:hypothetical protein QUF49_07525 [Fictibacillus sp. b24]|uniref:hypothetical protein n=1 Tax=Fictibacillus sp. b24 TaxID=3055863 RepID=UPI0025A043D7|nr:hypothetical protein [Fictibacillus sp. b24]MDM5315843.1 hypothetical protein [Fictibacillus sp. b24]
MNIFEAILELLFANIFFVILVAGGIFSFFKRMKETQNTSRPVPDRRAAEQPKQTVSPFGSPAQVEHQEIAESKAAEVGGKKYERQTPKRQKSADFNNRSNRYQDKEEEILSSFKVDQQELQKAIIWSEILSKPKAMQKR